MYGGAGGGGKSVALMMAAAQYLNVSGYNAILFRNSLTDLSLADSLIPMSMQWWSGTSARYNGTEHKWTFPTTSGGYSTLSFGYIQHAADKFRYKSAQYQFIGFDELTQFERDSYLFLFSRLRRPRSLDVPLRMRAATNPGGPGHEWVKLRFIVSEDPKRLFVPARMSDNPYLDIEQYESSLEQLDPVTRAQIRAGDWDTRPEGIQFKAEWFKGKSIDRPDCPMKMMVRYWDLAATKKKKGRSDPDYTCGALVGQGIDNEIYVWDIKRARGTPLEIEKLIKKTANEDGYDVHIGMEQEPGASGIFTIDRFRRLLIGYTFRAFTAVTDKVRRTDALASACEGGHVWFLAKPWTEDLLDELAAFDGVTGHDDQVDAVDGGFRMLTRGQKRWSANTFTRIFKPKTARVNDIKNLLLRRINEERYTIRRR